MPKAPRRSRKQNKVFFDWIPGLSIVLNQSYFTLADLFYLYQTSKAVQTLFTTFSLRLSFLYNPFKLVHVPDNVTWCKLFKSLKTEIFLERFKGHCLSLDGTSLIRGLMINGNIDLAVQIGNQFKLSFWKLELETLILTNGSRAVYEETLQKCSSLDPNWLELEKLDKLPPVPLFSAELAEMLELWEWFINDVSNLIYNEHLANFILDIGQLRSTVALNFLVDSLQKPVFNKVSEKNTQTLRDVILRKETVDAFYCQKKFRVRDLANIYRSWQNSKAREFVDQVVVPLEKYFIKYT